MLLGVNNYGMLNERNGFVNKGGLKTLIAICLAFCGMLSMALANEYSTQYLIYGNEQANSLYTQFAAITAVFYTLSVMAWVWAAKAVYYRE